jgi:hypothetical protein
MQCEVLRGNLAQDLLADRARPLAMADIGDTDMPKSLSQELPTQADVRTQCLGETSHEVLHHRSIVMNLGVGGFGVLRLLLFQLFDLDPDALVGTERLFKGAPLQVSLLDRPHDALCLPAELGELASARRGLGFEPAR